MKTNRFIEIIISILMFGIIILSNIYIFKTNLNVFFIFFFLIASFLIVLSIENLIQKKGIKKNIFQLFAGIDIIILSEIYLIATFTPIISIIFLGLFLMFIALFSISFLNFIFGIEEKEK